MATVDMFIKFDGIDGESTDSKHKGEMEPHAFYWGSIQTGKTSSGTGGAGAGKVRIEDLHVRARPSKASPKLFLYCCNGQPISKVTVTLRKAGKDQQEFLVYTMQNVLVSSYRSSIGFDVEQSAEGYQWEITGGATGSDDWMQYDDFSLNFGSMQVQYKQQNPDGTLGGAVTAGWDFTKNVAL